MSTVYSVDVRVTAPVEDTEIPDRVADAVRELFPEADVEFEPGRVVGHAHSMERFSERLHEQAILDTAREQFRAGTRGSTIRFALKKQAAFRGVINFSVGDPDELGDVSVRVDVEHPTVEEFVALVAPPTEDGEPVDPR